MKYLFIIMLSLTALPLQSQDFGYITPVPRQAYVRMQFSAMFYLLNHKTIYLDPDAPDYNHAWLFNSELRARGLDTFSIELWNGINNDIKGIILGMGGKFVNRMLNESGDQNLYITKDYPGAEGYAIDVFPMRAIIAGSDDAGLFYGINTFFQMVDKSISIFACRIVDAPEFPVRWFFYPMNFLVGANTTKLKSIWTEAASYKLNGAAVGDVKYSRIHNIEQRYIDSLLSVTKFAKEKHIEFVPMVMSWGYSNSLMFFNPNFAAGLPVREQRFVVAGDTGRLAPEVGVALANGDFENQNGNNFTGFTYIDKPGEMSFADNAEKHSGNTSIRFENFRNINPDNVNARVVFRAKVKPFSMYRMSAWVKTENVDCSDDIKIQALGNKNPTLSFFSLNIPRNSNGWKKYDIYFNSLQSDTVGFYWGIWGANSGRIWWDDLAIEETAFINMIRRPGATIEVKNYTTGEIYREGIDFDSLIDPKLGRAYSWLGEFDTYHQPPTFRIKQGGKIKNGDTLSISYYNTTTIYDGQAMVTMSDPALYYEIEREFRILDSLVKPKTYFMNHDEIRIMNWDKGDLDRGMTPGELLADNVNKCIEMIHKYNPRADIWDWSDMFDEYHNAVAKNYYLVNGDLRGSVDLLSKSMGIANWNSGKHEKSLDFFASKGFRQITAPYYDAGIANIRTWKEWTQTVPEFKGMMYTTWANDYSNLKGFAEYAWNHAPYVYHQPPLVNTPQGKLDFDILIQGDNTDNSWQAMDITLHYRTYPLNEFTELSEQPLSENVILSIDLPTGNKWLQYYLTAKDNKGWVTRIPFGEGQYYELGDFLDDVQDEALPGNMIFPNPAEAGKKVILINNSNIKVIEIFDVRGNVVRTFNLDNLEGKIQLDTYGMAPGIYIARISSSSGISALKLVLY